LLGRLTATGVGLGLLRLQLDAEHTVEARATLAALQNDFQLLLHGVAGELAARPRSSPATVPKRQKALLVEDDGNQRELPAGFLRQSGLVVDTAGDGADALDYLRTRGTPDLVLLDMGLPRVDGPTTVREIRRDPAFAGLKIFGVTGRLPGEFDLAYGPAGVDRWVPQAARSGGTGARFGRGNGSTPLPRLTAHGPSPLGVGGPGHGSGSRDGKLRQGSRAYGAWTGRGTGVVPVPLFSTSSSCQS
jgi:CheY-like chemotaxis protein